MCYVLAKKESPDGLQTYSTRAKAETALLARCITMLYMCLVDTWASFHTFTRHSYFDSQVRRKGYFAQSILHSFLVGSPILGPSTFWEVLL